MVIIYPSSDFASLSHLLPQGEKERTADHAGYSLLPLREKVRKARMRGS